ncbi:MULTISPECIES: GFA family protein [unclassified Sinorhizobium]|uniref:GFA family protein n=1 Tax=unclassified Sinorhizobium TaxID=2613772 RepID=UPI003525ACA8
MADKTTHLSCTCKAFRLAFRGSPIISTECHCNSCNQAASRLEPLTAQTVRTAHGGTRYVLYRKDRIGFPAGTDMLQEFRLHPHATTRRVLTSCCKTPIFLEFKGGHWLSLYGNLWQQDDLPPLDLRTMTEDADNLVPEDVPAGMLATTSFYTRLFMAWVAMRFKVPTVLVKGVIDA